MGTRSQTSTRPGGKVATSESGVARSVTAARTVDPGGVAAGIIAGAKAAAQTGVAPGDVDTVTYGDVEALLAASAGQAGVIDTVVAEGDGGFVATADIDETVLV